MLGLCIGEGVVLERVFIGVGAMEGVVFWSVYAGERMCVMGQACHVGAFGVIIAAPCDESTPTTSTTLWRVIHKSSADSQCRAPTRT